MQVLISNDQMSGGSPYQIVVNRLYCDIIVSEFEFQSVMFSFGLILLGKA